MGGIGSGKSFGGAALALSMPAGSIGMVIAPTYPMLRDATLPALRDLAERAGVVRRYAKSEMRLDLHGDRTVLFRSADDPDRLRGPNLGWFWADEAAMLSEDTWMIMIGRLRLSPGLAWITTTPRGCNWVHKLFVKEASPDHKLIKASTTTNPFLPEYFHDTLKAAYSSHFAQQELEGEFLADDTAGLIPPAWIDAMCGQGRPAPARRTSTWMGVDPSGGKGQDRSAIVVRDRDQLLEIWASNVHGVLPDAQHRLEPEVARLAAKWNVPAHQIVFDANGLGSNLGSYLRGYGLPDTKPYFGGSSGGLRFANLRTACAFALRRRLDPCVPGAVPFYCPASDDWASLRQELVELRTRIESSSLDGPREALELKADLKARLGRSPDFADALLASVAYPDW